MDDFDAKPERTHRIKGRRWGGAGSILKQSFGMFPGFPAYDHENRPIWRHFPNQPPSHHGQRKQPAYRNYRLCPEWIRNLQTALIQLRRQRKSSRQSKLEDPDHWDRRIVFLLREFREILEHRSNWSIDRWLQSDLLPNRRVRRLSLLRRKLPQLKPVIDQLMWLDFTAPHNPTEELEEWLEHWGGKFEAIYRVLGKSADAMLSETVVNLYGLRKQCPEKFQVNLINLLTNPEAWLLPIDERFSGSLLQEALDPNQPPRRNEKILTNCIEVVAFSKAEFVSPNQSLAGRLAKIPSELIRQSAEECFGRAELVAFLLDGPLPIAAANHFLNTFDTTWLKLQNQQLQALQRPNSTPSDPAGDANLSGQFRRVAGQNHGREFFGLVEIAILVKSIATKTSHKLKTWRGLVNSIPKFSNVEGWRLVANSLLATFDREADLWNLDLVYRVIKKRGFPQSAWEEARSLGSELRDPQTILDRYIMFPTYNATDSALEFFETLVYESNGQFNENSFVRFCRFREHFGSSEECLAFMHDTKDLSEYDYQIPMLLSVTRDPVQIRQLFESCPSGEFYLYFLALACISREGTDPEIRSLALRSALQRDWHLILRWAKLLQVHTETKLPMTSPPKLSSDCSWISSYPAEFSEPLSRLAEIREDAEEIATRKLAALFPPRSRLEQERNAILAKLNDSMQTYSQPRLRHRLDQLERQLQGKWRLDPKLVNKTIAKLNRQIDRLQIERICLAASERVLKECERITGLSPVPKKLAETPYFDLLCGMLELKPKMRLDGLHLLIRAAQGESVTPAKDPRNQRFIESVQKLGVNVEPWLDESVSAHGRTSDGEDYFVRFSNDVLDTLLMGHHFNTCLHPTAINFYSTISNWKDINKRVAYGKTVRGRIIGRRLFALSDDGGILSFASYAHELNDKFEATSAKFASSLAEQMKTFLTFNGKVSNLTVERWYDDGAAPLNEPQSLEAADGFLLKLLREKSGREVYLELERNFGGKERLERQLFRLLSIDEVCDHASLISELAQRFGTEPTGLATRLKLVFRCLRAGQSELAKRIFRELPRKETLAILEKNACVSCGTVHSFEIEGDFLVSNLLEWDPPMALRFVNQIERQPPACSPYSRQPFISDELRAKLKTTIWGGPASR